MKLYALVDCSGFYCSCERVFRPDLKDKPIVVLSNNDGCVIARDDHAKALGIEMGAPFFQVKQELKRLGITVFSSNYELYADMSRRVMAILEDFIPDLERYSIDEAFLRLEVDETQPQREFERITKLAYAINEAVWRGVGIPVRVSFAETKTLAKVGSDYAKKLLKQGQKPCVCFWQHPEREAYLEAFPVEDIWGIGRAKTENLNRLGVRTAAQLRALPDAFVKKHYTIVTLKTVMELRGLSCLPLEQVPERRKSMVRSRMFGHKLSELAPISQAISSHIFRAAEKLRTEKLLTTILEVYVYTGRHVELRRKGVAVAALPEPTSDPLTLNRYALHLLEQCYRDADEYGNPYRYSKCGVILHELVDQSDAPARLLPDVLEQPERRELTKAMDAINRRYGKRTVMLGSMGTPAQSLAMERGDGRRTARWSMQRQSLSPRYTTKWGELLKAY